MLNEFRKIDLTWDKATRRIYDIVRVASSDENGRKLVVQVLNGGQVENLSGTSLHLYWETANEDNKGLDAFEVVDAAQGIFQIYFTTGMVSNIGVLTAHLHLADDQGTVTSEPFKISVFEGVDNDAVESSDSFTALTDALVTVNRYDSRISNVENSKADRTDVEEVTSQLAQTEQDIIDSVTINPTFNYAEELKIEKGSELVDVNSAILGSGWTREGSGFRHSSGSNPLTIPIAGLSSTKQYEIVITVTNPASGPGGQSDFWLRLGGTAEFETYDGGGTTYKYVMYAGNTDSNLIIRPWEDYQGVITVSVKEIVGGQLPSLIGIYDNQDKVLTEIRTGEFGSNSLYLGYNSGRWSPDGYRNTAVGDIAMSRMTTGFWNTGLGYGTLQENTVGTRNVALGYIALRNNISGGRNIAIGSFAMTNLKTGRNNIAIGVDSYYHADRGEGNIAIGLLALGTADISNNNIAIGNSAMSNSSSSELNVAVGNSALRNTRGNGNVAVGEDALRQNVTGTFNTGLGYKALENNSAGAHNVAVGLHAGRYLKTGSNNILLGENAGLNSNGSENIALGKRTIRELKSGDNNVVIGSQASELAESGEHNVAIGFGSMTSGPSGMGLYNVAVGRNSLRNIASGEGNVALGNESLLRISSGKRNIGIGLYAGRQITTGYDNILIGAFTEVKSPTANKQLNIGNAITSDNYETGTIDFKKIKLTDLPTTAPTETGAVWNDNGTLKIV